LARSGIAPVELSIDQRLDVDTIDPYVVDLAVDVDLDELHTAHPDPVKVDRTEAGIAQVDGAKLGAAKINALKPRTLEILTEEVSHASTLVTMGRRMECHV
jgi:hypothetical protein